MSGKGQEVDVIINDPSISELVEEGKALEIKARRSSRRGPTVGSGASRRRESSGQKRSRSPEIRPGKRKFKRILVSSSSR